MMDRLKSAEECHAQNPDTFWIPDKEDRNSLQPGDFAKVIFKTYTGDNIRGERIWIHVTGRVHFRAEHVIDITRKGEA